jgi:hypothetical protein
MPLESSLDQGFVKILSKVFDGMDESMLLFRWSKSVTSILFF